MGQEVAGSSKINVGKGEGIEPQRHGGHRGGRGDFMQEGMR
jgi:hypothetical protein